MPTPNHSSPSVERSLEAVLDGILRGAAKLLGCTSSTLILINEKAGAIRIRAGILNASFSMARGVAELVGGDLQSIELPLDLAVDSLVLASWGDQAVRETGSLKELVGGALLGQNVDQINTLIGLRRFICIPVSASRRYGILLLEKPGHAPFSSQQREVITRYGNRVAEILENDLRGQSWDILRQPSAERVDGVILLDGAGQLIAQSPGASDPFGDQTADAAATLAQAEAKGLVNRVIELESPRHPGAKLYLLGPPHRLADTSLENQLLQLSLGAPAPSFFVDPAGSVTSCNEAAQQLVGLSGEAIVGRSVSEFFHEPHTIERLLLQLLSAPCTPTAEQKVLMVRAAGPLLAAQVEALLLANADEQAVGFLLLVRPSEVLDESPEGAAHRERLATMGEMATQLAHEVRNPLLAVGASLNSLATEPDLPPEHQSLLRALTREVERLDMVLKDYLSARHPLSFAPVGIEKLVHESALLLRGGRLGSRRVVNEVPADLFLRADYDALKHVFFNLIHNAMEASPAHTEIRCHAKVHTRDVVIYIDDEGPGLAAPAETCLRPFFTTKKNGTGLGLPVCAKVISAHGGVLSLSNRDSGGCRVSLTFPRPK